MMYLIVPLSVGVVAVLLQFMLLRPLGFCCNVKPVEGDSRLSGQLPAVDGKRHSLAFIVRA